MGILVVVESPNKIEKIQSVLGQGYKVLATVGHVCDLPDDDMGVNIENFKPRYVITEQGRKALEKIVDALKQHDRILFATDPDREGEAIAFFVGKILGLNVDEIIRVDVRDMSEQGIKAAFQNYRRLDYDLVKAQEARRVLDRLIGFSFSKKLSQVSGTKMAAGRVQSAVLKMICDLEDEVKNFQSQTHYKVIFNMGDWEVRWNSRPHHTDESKYMLNHDLAVIALNINSLTVEAVASEEQTVEPPPPFTTAKLIKVCALLLDLSPDEVMKSAQKLFVAGLITYHRTDSTRLSDVAVSEIRSYLLSQGFKIPDAPITHENRSKNAQEAHEAIRPVDIKIASPNGLTEADASIYTIIHRQAMASQMDRAKRVITKVKIIGDNEFEYQAKGVEYIDYGFLNLLPELMSEFKPMFLPPLSEGQQLYWNSSAIKNEKTKPPFRYTYSSLIEAMEIKGIGRPSTYATIFNTLIDRHKYVVKIKRSLRPTSLGEAAIDSLKNATFVEQKYSSSLENKLDEVSLGSETYEDLMKSAYETIEKDLGQVAPSSIRTTPCPVCADGILRERKGTHGKFWGCSNYPECKHTQKDIKG